MDIGKISRSLASKGMGPPPLPNNGFSKKNKSTFSDMLFVSCQNEFAKAEASAG